MSSVPAIIKPKKREHPLESKVETDYKIAVAKLGGVSWKFNSKNHRSVTDQITLIFGRVIFAEIKAHGKGLSEKQGLFRDKVVEHGGEHVTIVGHDGIALFIEKLKDEMTWWQKIWASYNSIITKFNHIYGYVHVPKKRKKKPVVKKK